MIFTPESGQEAGNRFYLSYAGSAPSGDDCTTLAGDIEAAWSEYLKPMTNESWVLTEIDVLDITTDSGFSGQWTGGVTGTRAGTVLPQQVATNVEFDIARRYRGGKPRIFLPPGVVGDEDTNATWGSDYLSDMNEAVANFFSDITSSSVGSMGTLAHVNLSYYKGFTNVTNPSGRTKAKPTYRATALHDDVLGYATKAVMGSQRRRRTALTP